MVMEQDRNPERCEDGTQKGGPVDGDYFRKTLDDILKELLKVKIYNHTCLNCR